MNNFYFNIAFRIYRLLSAQLLPRIPVHLRHRLITSLYYFGRRYFPERVRSDAAPLQTINLRIPAIKARPLPEWVFGEMRTLCEFEPLLYPSNQWKAPTACSDTPDYSLPGHIYALLGNEITQPYRHVILAPWLKQGGADLGTLHWAATLASSSRKDVLVIATETTDSPWQAKLPPTVKFLDFGNLAKELSRHERSIVLGRLLVQHPPETVHVINSLAGWWAVERYGAAILSKSRIFASVYCDDYSADGTPRGYGRTALPFAWQNLTRVFSDNAAYPKRLQSSLGLPEELFRTIYFPTNCEGASNLYGETNRVLWASRLDRQKRPDLLYSIACAAPELEFHVYGEPLLDEGKHWQRRLKRLPNVVMRGRYDGFKSIQAQAFCAFLYTSAWDGLPNVLLEASVAGLPIVASNVGGVGDLITEDTGFPVNEPEDAAAYVSALRAIRCNPSEGLSRRRRAMDLIEQRHTLDAFSRAVTEMLDQ